MNKGIYILGIGRNTPVFIDLVESCGYSILGLYHYDDTRTGEIDHGYRIMGSFNDLFSKGDLSGMNFSLSQGDIGIRSALFDKILAHNGNIPTLIHPTASVSKFATIGKGCIIHINAIVHPDVVIGDNTVLSYNTAVTHSSQIGRHCYLAASALIGAYTKIEDSVFIGIGVQTISSKVDIIGEHSYIGAGSLVTKSIDAYSVAVGRPAKVIRKIYSEKE